MPDKRNAQVQSPPKVRAEPTKDQSLTKTKGERFIENPHLKLTN
jgi:hypothetical protein